LSLVIDNLRVVKIEDEYYKCKKQLTEFYNYKKTVFSYVKQQILAIENPPKQIEFINSKLNSIVAIHISSITECTWNDFRYKIFFI